MKHRPELQSHTANWRRPTRSGVRRYRWSHRNSPRAPTEPNAWGDAPPHKRNKHQRRKPYAKTRCKRGDNATGPINETDAQKRLRARSGHSQRASARPTAEADKANTKKERGMEWVSDSDRASNWGTNARKVTDPWRGRTKQRGKNSPTRSRREDHSKRTSSHKSPRESSGRGRSLTRRRRLQAPPLPPPKKKPADRRQSRAGGPGSGPTARGAQWRAPRTSQDQQHQWGPPGKRAQAEPPIEVQNPSRQKVGQGTQDNPRPAARVMEATLNPNMGQWRTLEGAKDNLSSRTQRGPPGNTPWRTGRAETPQTEVWGPTMNWPVYLTQTGTRNLRSNRGQTILDLAGATPSRR